MKGEKHEGKHGDNKVIKKEPENLGRDRNPGTKTVKKKKHRTQVRTRSSQGNQKVQYLKENQRWNMMPHIMFTLLLSREEPQGMFFSPTTRNSLSAGGAFSDKARA